MNRLLATALFPTLLLGFWCTPSAALELGAQAPALSLPDAEGTPLPSANGQVRLVDFWASWCGPCRHSFPWMNAMQQKYGAQGLQIVGVNVDEERADADRFLAKVPASFQIVFDPSGETPAAWSVKGMPTSYLVGRDGKVLWRHLGFNVADAPELEAAIESALGTP